MKNIVITGVSTGIGYATAKKFIAKGHRVFGSVRKQSDADALAADLGPNFEPLIFDVIDDKAVLQAAEIVKKRVGTEGVALLVNNAGIAVSGPLQHIDNDEFIHQFNINVFGVQRVTQAFLLLLGASFENVPKGKIINVSSVSGIISTAFLGPYCASKAALNAMTDSLRRELVLFDIPVVIVQPGPIKTPIWEKARQEINFYPDTEYAQLLESSLKKIDTSEKQAVPVEQVSDLIYQIFKHPKPKTRYTVVKNKAVIKMISWLPHTWLDVILKRQMVASLKK